MNIWDSISKQFGNITQTFGDKDQNPIGKIATKLHKEVTSIKGIMQKGKIFETSKNYRSLPRKITEKIIKPTKSFFEQNLT